VARILVVEDEAHLAEGLAFNLEAEGHEVEIIGDGVEAAARLAREPRLDAVILDVMLPGLSGTEVCRALRAESDVPILMLTARDAISDRVVGLDAGADDYLVKPFAYAELSARLRALGRRAVAPTRPGVQLVSGPIVMDDALRSVTVAGRDVSLSPREFGLLEAFLRHPGQVMTRDQLLDLAWPYGVAVTPNAVDTYVHYLRDKLGEAGARIETVRGVGYRLRPS